MPTATMTSKGQITIPIKIRKALGLGTGDKIDFVEIENGRVAMIPRTGSIMDLKGCFPKLGYVPTIEEMDEAILDAAAENYLAGVSHAPSASQKDEAA
jgi:AbrB family looped-hinge helix DNA binding protein